MTKERVAQIVSEAETLPLDDAARKKEGSDYIALPKTGITRYEMKGEGEPIVMTHGYATPMYIYDKLFDFFLEKGYKVIRYDLVGRGMSERVDAVYDADFFALQLRELTNALLGDEKFILFGTSMGGTITTTFCEKYPGFVKKLVLLAPAGMSSFKPPFYMKLCKIPGFGSWLFNLIGAKSLLNGCASEMKHSMDEVDDYMEKFGECLRFKGFLRCTLSSLLNTILETEKATEAYKSVAKQKIPLLVIWGTADKTMPFYQQKQMKEICPHGKFITYEGSGHIFLFDEGERTAKDVFEFLSQG